MEIQPNKEVSMVKIVHGAQDPIDMYTERLKSSVHQSKDWTTPLGTEKKVSWVVSGSSKPSNEPIL